MRAHLNTTEILGTFVLTVLVAMLANADARLVNIATSVFVGARLLHMLAYYANHAIGRIAGFALGLLATFALAITCIVTLLNQ